MTYAWVLYLGICFKNFLKKLINFKNIFFPQVKNKMKPQVYKVGVEKKNSIIFYVF